MNYPFTPCSTVQSSLERINGIVATVVIIPTNAEGEEKDILKKKFQGINKKNYFFGNFIINFWNEKFLKITTYQIVILSHNN